MNENITVSVLMKEWRNKWLCLNEKKNNERVKKLINNCDKKTLKCN